MLLGLLFGWYCCFSLSLWWCSNAKKRYHFLCFQTKVRWPFKTEDNEKKKWIWRKRAWGLDLASTPSHPLLPPSPKTARKNVFFRKNVTRNRAAIEVTLDPEALTPPFRRLTCLCLFRKLSGTLWMNFARWRVRTEKQVCEWSSPVLMCPSSHARTECRNEEWDRFMMSLQFLSHNLSSTL